MVFSGTVTCALIGLNKIAGNPARSNTGSGSERTQQQQQQPHFQLKTRQLSKLFLRVGAVMDVCHHGGVAEISERLEK